MPCDCIWTHAAQTAIEVAVYLPDVNCWMPIIMLHLHLTAVALAFTMQHIVLAKAAIMCSCCVQFVPITLQLLKYTYS